MTKHFTPARCGTFVHDLLAWFARAMRPLPWRESYDPYSVWISEIMLQQTQMERGVRYYRRWMLRFPDLRSVAEAGEEEVLAAWEGLGYYSRARNLHAAAQYIMREYGGKFPDTPEALRKLPGVGEYTAGAIAAIAFNLVVPAVDANVLRIFARLLDIDAPVDDKSVRAAISETVASLIPADSPRLFNQALMELGALVCGKTPKCGDCPLASLCLAASRGTVADRPKKKKNKTYSELEMVAAVIVWNDRVLVSKRPPDGLWGGLWEFPNLRLGKKESPERRAEDLARDLTKRRKNLITPIAAVRHGYTTHRVIMHGYLITLDKDETVARQVPVNGQWVFRSDLAGMAFPAGQRKLLERLGWKTTSR